MKVEQYRRLSAACSAIAAQSSDHLPDMQNRWSRLAKCFSDLADEVARTRKERSRYTRARSVLVDGHKTNISLDVACWDALKEIAKTRNISMSTLLSTIRSGRHPINLSAEIRLFVVKYYNS